MRVLLVYDCLFPHTVGGGERWYRQLAERLAAAGHDVSYLTLRQWERGEQPDAPAGVRVVASGPRLALYDDEGRRRIAPPLAFGGMVLWHLLRHGGRYDVVHTASFPYFSLLAAAVARRTGRRFRLVVDWFELWSREYWADYLGPRGGRVGWLVQKACLRVPQRAFTFARLTAGRLEAEGLRGPVTTLAGMHDGGQGASEPAPAADEVVFAGRLIPEKRAAAVVGAVARARADGFDGLRATIFGDGPQRDELAAEVARLDASAWCATPGFVAAEEIEAAMRRALCLLAPSQREGYGLVVVEAASRGTPVVVAAGPDNAATELVEEGVNGFVAPSASPQDLAAAILRVRDAGPELRASTLRWYERHADRLSLERSLETVVATYAAR